MEDERDELIEIDPELYMTCRLCVEEKGKFQILPKLQEKIKYAFDIDVALFDGFSQLMCEKCKTTVIDYSAVKEKLQAKQRALLAKAKIPVQSADTAANTGISKTNGDAIITISDVLDKSETDVRASPLLKKKKKQKKNKKKVLYSSSSSDDEPIQPPPSPPISIKSTKSLIIVDEESEEQVASETSWKDLYKLTYVCRYCNKKLTYKNSMKDHIRTHDHLLRKRRKVARWHSTVQVERFEDSPNLTGDNKVVVFKSNQLLTETDNPDYYAIYAPKDIYTKPPPTYISSDSKDVSSDSDQFDPTKKKRFTCVDVTSEEDERTHRPKLRKRIRLQSNLSVDTVDLQADSPEAPDEGSSGTPAIQNQHSDASAITACKSKRQKIKSSRSDFDTIKQIISASLEHEKKKNNKTIGQNKQKLDEDDILRRKLLSIGSKVMVKQGLVSLGLLKFIEQRNLKIQWIANTNNTNTSGKDATYVRIQTKLLESQEPNNLNCFEPCEDSSNEQTETPSERALRVSTATNIQQPKLPKKRPVVAPRPKTIQQVQTSLNVINTPVPQTLGLPLSSDSQTLVSITSSPTTSTPATSVPLLPALPNTTLVKTSKAVLSSSSSYPGEALKNPLLLKVLNESPVANPKKAVKKKSNDTFGIQQQQSSPSSTPVSNSSPSAPVSNSLVPTNVSSDHNYTSNSICLDSDEEETSQEISELTVVLNKPPPSQNKNSLLRPLIVANSSGFCMPIITSAESLAKNEKDDVPEKSNEASINVPRIKCKPVSELMGGQEDQVTLPQLNNSVYNSMQLSNGNLEINPIKTSDVKRTVDTKTIPPGHVVLHTVSLPYTVTNKPFDYFCKLLRMHLLYLVDSCSSPTFEFVNLVKFRLGVHQHPVSVMLCLSLETYGSSFRISVKNKSDEEVDVHTMSALWQWEVLKAFNSSSVITKIRQAAEKEQSANQNFSNRFISLLGSIKLLSDGQGATSTS